MVALSKLRALQTLNVSNTDFNHHGLEIVASDLPQLEHLDISNTRVNDITPLKKCRLRLKTLAMYNLKVSPCVKVFNELGFEEMACLGTILGTNFVSILIHH